MKSFKFLSEAAYKGNIGFEEMVRFYRKANKAQEKNMDKAVKDNDFNLFKSLILQVIGVTLK